MTYACTHCPAVLASRRELAEHFHRAHPSFDTNVEPVVVGISLPEGEPDDLRRLVLDLVEAMDRTAPDHADVVLAELEPLRRRALAITAGSATGRPEREPGPAFSPDEEAHVTRTESLPIVSGVEAIDDLARLMAQVDTASMTAGGRRLDYDELAGLSLGFWHRRSRTPSAESSGSEASSLTGAPRRPGDAHTAADPVDTTGGA